MKRGTQIIYVPYFANDDTDHPACETGFVVRKHGIYEMAYCRYWSKSNPDELHTKSCSELTQLCRLVIHDSVSQLQVEAALEEYCGE